MSHNDPSIVPGEKVVQIAFYVPDLKAAIDWWTNEGGIGPWFVLDRIGNEASTFRGQPAEAQFTIALAMSGTLMLELVQTLDDKPSIYKEQREQRGYGFHHLGQIRADAKQLASAYLAKGRSIPFEGAAPGNGYVYFVDGGDGGQGMIELIEDNEVMQRMSGVMRRASERWNGEQPIRGFGELLA